MSYNVHTHTHIAALGMFSSQNHIAQYRKKRVLHVHVCLYYNYMYKDIKGSCLTSIAYTSSPESADASPVVGSL